MRTEFFVLGNRVGGQHAIRHALAERLDFIVAGTSADTGEIGQSGGRIGHCRRQHAEVDVLFDAAADDELAKEMIEPFAVKAAPVLRCSR